MTYIKGHARNQMLLILLSIDNDVAADNPVRFIESFVDDCDLAAAGFGVRKLVNWVAKRGPDFIATMTRKQR